MISAKHKQNLSRILPFGIIWLVFGIVFLIIEYAATKNSGNTPAGVIQLDASVLVFALSAVTIVGLVIGLIEIRFINRYFSRSSFLTKFFGKFIIYTLFLSVIILITYPIAASLELSTSIFNTVVWQKFYEFTHSISFLSTAFQMAISLIMSLFYNEISQSMGSHVFLDFIRGKYHRPKSEHRIFMFLDMKSSTTIAESIGHQQYFKLLKEYYYILSNAIIEYSGDIYQYVGDEMVISWRRSQGLKNYTCIQCFYKMKRDLEAKREWFINEFGQFPDFKAGLHLGEVTTGEIGSVKKDIIFTGDVLNATARIQSLCNDLNVDILLSETLVDSLALGNDFVIVSHGTKNLRGKTTAMTLYSLQLNA